MMAQLARVGRRQRTEIVPQIDKWGKSDAIKPWRKEAPWWVQAIEALVVLGLGIYVLTQAPRPISWIGVLITLLMITLGAVYLYSVLQASAAPLTAIGWLLIAVGVALGAYSAYNWYSNRQTV